MISSLGKAWDVVLVEANHSQKLLKSRLQINRGEVSDSLNLLGVRNATMRGNNMTTYFKV